MNPCSECKYWLASGIYLRDTLIDDTMYNFCQAPQVDRPFYRTKIGGAWPICARVRRNCERGKWFRPKRNWFTRLLRRR